MRIVSSIRLTQEPIGLSEWYPVTPYWTVYADVEIYSIGIWRPRRRPNVLGVSEDSPVFWVSFVAITRRADTTLTSDRER